MRNPISLIVFGIINLRVDAKEDLRRTWTLYHSMDPRLGEKGFTKRGVVTLEPENNQAKLTLENDEKSFSAENLEVMMMSGWYQVKLVEDGKTATVPVKTTIPACHLRRANFRDEITLSFGQQGHVISLAYSPLISPLAPKTCDDLPAPQEIQFNSKVEYETAVPGMSLKTILPNYQPPPGLKFISSKHKSPGSVGGDAKPEGFGTKEEKELDTGIMGFFRRYWYIILPIFLMQMMGATEPEQTQQGQQQGGAGEGQVAAAPAAQGGGGNPKRRGKRG
eukprot:scaffold2046_cov171-Amphora_coffeaeformis.AAC.1